MKNKIIDEDLLGPVSKEVAEVISTLAKAVLAAEQFLNLDMGDGEPTYMCCCSVCGHGPPNCPISQAAVLAQMLTRLDQKDIEIINKMRGNKYKMFPIKETELVKFNDISNYFEDEK